MIGSIDIRRYVRHGVNLRLDDMAAGILGSQAKFWSLGYLPGVGPCLVASDNADNGGCPIFNSDGKASGLRSGQSLHFHVEEPGLIAMLPFCETVALRCVGLTEIGGRQVAFLGVRP